GVMIFGIDPAREQKVAKIFRKVDQGRFFAADTTAEIVVGYKLLDNLQAHIGDTVVVLSQGYDGSLGNLKFRIVGSVKTGFPEMDGAVVLMGLSTAQDLLTLYGRVSLIAISLKSLDDVFPVQRRLNARLPDPALVVLNWQEIMPDLAQAIELDNVSGFIFSALLVLIVGFGIMNTVLMSVTERFREFGVSLAIGMPNRMLVYLIFLETACLAVIGLVLGNLMGAAINLYIVHHPIVFTGEFAQLYQEYGFLPRLESTLKPIIFISATLVTGLIALLACLYPAYRVFKLEPLRGIRYT
ncbi:MAG: ABC transporter permease, partial [Calditrichaeota bacterium]